MKTKLLFILLLGLISCAKEKIDDKPLVKYQDIIGTWIAQDKNSHYDSFTFGAHKEYILTKRKDGNKIQGYLKVRGNRIQLEELGLIEIIDLNKRKSLSFSLLEGNNTSFYFTKKKE